MPGHRRHLTSLRKWDTNFDQGGAASITEEDGKIRITPRFDWDSKWLWHAMRSDRLAGQTPHFLIAKADRFAAYSVNENVAVWATSPDTDTWYKFDNQTVGASDAEFYNNAPFPNGMIYVSYLPLYPFSRVGRVYREWLKDTRVSVVSVGQATRRAGAEGRSAPGLPWYGLKLTNASGFTKNNMVLISGVHPNETTGQWELEGAMAWLLAGSVEAEFLLDWFDIYVYPCVNNQGVHLGYFRSSPEYPAKDSNRYWDTTSELEFVDALKTAWTANHANLEVGIDFHASVDDDTVYGNAVNPAEAIHAAFTAEMVALQATFDMRTFDMAGISNKYWIDSMSAALAIVIEAGAVNTQTLAQVKGYGQNALKSVAYMHADGRWTNGPGVGARSFNGSTDRIDWSSITNLSNGAFTISAWVYLNSYALNTYIVCIYPSGDTGLSIVMNFNDATNRYFNLVITGATSMIRGSAVNGAISGAWYHYLATWNGGALTDATNGKLYRSGVELSYITPTNGSGTQAPAGSWSIGGRIYDDARNFPGDIAQVGVWSRVLTSTEITNLAAGYAPDLAAPTDLEFYFKGNTASLDDEITNAEGTADGTSSVTGVGNGPGIIYG